MLVTDWSETDTVASVRSRSTIGYTALFIELAVRGLVAILAATVVYAVFVYLWVSLFGLLGLEDVGLGIAVILSVSPAMYTAYYFF